MMIKRYLNNSAPTDWAVVHKYRRLVDSGRLLPDERQWKLVNGLLQPKLDQLRVHYAEATADTNNSPHRHRHHRQQTNTNTTATATTATTLLQRMRHQVLSSFGRLAGEPLGSEGINYKPPAVKGLYLYGGVGTGKTMLMDMFYSAVPGTRKRRVHFNAFMLDIHSRIHQAKIVRFDGHGTRGNHNNYHNNNDDDPLPQIINHLSAEAWLLCFDEFQVTDIADAMILRRLLSGLISRGVVLLTTSNRPPDELYKNGIQRQSFIPCIQLLKQHCDVYQLDAAAATAKNSDCDSERIDYRKLTMATTTTTTTTTSPRRYIYPLDAAAEEHVNSIFNTLCSQQQQQHKVTERQLTTLGRPIRVPRQCGTVAMFTFQQLCMEAMSAADYLELCRHYTTVVLTDIPQLSPYTQRNELRRFITLIDALYEHRVRLYCSAATTPTNLLITLTADTHSNTHNTAKQEESQFDEVFAFNRTVSRLMQMQSANWPPYTATINYN